MAHPDDCECMTRLSTVADLLLTARTAQVKAIWAAAEHGASIRQISRATGVARATVSQIVAARDEADADAEAVAAAEQAPGEAALHPADDDTDEVDAEVEPPDLEPVEASAEGWSLGIPDDETVEV